jgi:hypothetical protein
VNTKPPDRDSRLRVPYFFGGVGHYLIDSGRLFLFDSLAVISYNKPERREPMGELKNRARVSFAIDKKVYERLRNYANKMMIPMSRIIDRSVTEYLDKVEKK